MSHRRHRICSGSRSAYGQEGAERMEPNALYDGPAHNAIFYVPSAGMVRFAFSDPSASGYVRSRNGSLARVHPGAREFLSAGEHVLTFYDPELVARVSIVFITN